MAYNTIDELRAARDVALHKTDFLFRPDIELDEGDSALLFMYCTELRNITDSVDENNVGDVVLPLPKSPILATLLKVDVFTPPSE
jgi:hypothetical protein